MDAKTALLIAVGLALGLPYITVALLQGGSIGLFVFTGLFVVAFALVILSDIRSGTSVESNDTR
jgi:hypothetical protein